MNGDPKGRGPVWQLKVSGRFFFVSWPMDVGRLVPLGGMALLEGGISAGIAGDIHARQLLAKKKR